MTKLLHNTKQQGFSLIEVVISGALVATTVGALLAVSSMTNKLTIQSQERIIASQLAREGIEVVRQIRDQRALSQEIPSCGEGQDCVDWRLALVGESDIQSLQNGATLHRAVARSLTGFTLERVLFQPANSCGEYITRETLASAPSLQPPLTGLDVYCRRIFIEPVDDVTVGNTTVNEAVSMVRIRSQVAWLGNGRNGFRQSFDSPQCASDKVEWCTEQVTLLSDWRPQ